MEVLTQQRALSRAMALTGKDAPPEVIASLTALIYNTWIEGFNAGCSVDAKKMYWTGVKVGITKHSWIKDAVRYVGVGAVTLVHALEEVDKQMKMEMEVNDDTADGPVVQ